MQRLALCQLIIMPDILKKLPRIQRQFFFMNVIVVYFKFFNLIKSLTAWDKSGCPIS
jgi:hypothetical protein